MIAASSAGSRGRPLRRGVVVTGRRYQARPDY
jgi:hypothetical protein